MLAHTLPAIIESAVLARTLPAINRECSVSMYLTSHRKGSPFSVDTFISEHVLEKHVFFIVVLNSIAEDSDNVSTLVAEYLQNEGKTRICGLIQIVPMLKGDLGAKLVRTFHSCFTVTSGY